MCEKRISPYENVVVGYDGKRLQIRVYVDEAMVEPRLSISGSCLVYASTGGARLLDGDLRLELSLYRDLHGGRNEVERSSS